MKITVILLISFLIFVLSARSDAIVVYTTIDAEEVHPHPELEALSPDEVALAIVTAYSSTEDQTDSTPYLTAHQSPVGEGIVACPRKIPFGTEIIIAGQIYTCEDRMALKNDGKYDVWMPTRKLALEWGIKKVSVIIK